MNKKLVTLLLSIVCLVSCNAGDSTTTIINLHPSDSDMTAQLRSGIESAKGDHIKIILDDGIYYAKPDYAFEKYCAITNHGNGVKKILFPLSGFKSVEIVGNGAKIICHGQLFPFLIEGCQNVTVSDLTIDWDIPFTFLAEVVETNAEEGWRDVRPRTEGFSWTFARGQITYPNIDGFSYKYLGSTLPFDKDTKRVVPGAIDFTSKPTKIEKRKDGVFRIYEKLKYYPPVGSLLSSKGDRENDRYAPAFDFVECRDVVLQNVTIHHALGMAFLFERTENITLKDSRVVLAEGSPRVIASTADATHFANCKGDVLIEGCRFENMLDDGTNVHGTYVSVQSIKDSKSVVVALEHFEQLGFKFAEAGDEVWFILSPSPSRHSVNVVSSAVAINEKFIELTFEQDIPKELKVGDIIENKTWNPTFTMKGCTIQNNRARSIVLKTPLKTVIEDNYFSSMMSAVLFRGESFFWYESGGVEDVVIRNNYFKNAGDCGTKHAALYITPKLGETFDESEPFDKNITFESNTIDSYLPRIVIAESTEGLIIKGNKIIVNNDGVAPFPADPLFDFSNCRDVTIENNEYVGAEPTNVLVSDKTSKANLTVANNKGFTIK
ncbi:MAG: right-handed parallel beta-helix repeat-containing protein [Rikenellaceae bacterium]